ncbi:hypothetical protein M0Q50_07440 [bacterium]|jgi:hypothetical protein|nr:hypothetical protein [bacterium]
MKVGDIIVCKEDYIVYNSKTHTKGNKYKILDIRIDDMIVISTDSNTKHGLNFSIDNIDSVFHLYKYFYTIQELRKLKLETI